MNQVLVLRNPQRVRRLPTAALRRATRWLLEEGLRETRYELCLHFVGPRRMAQINQQFLQHEGSTDVITFDSRQSAADPRVCGEIFISVQDAVTQARIFGTTWREEVLRYIVHGILHLLGYDDLEAGARRVMKRAENKWLRAVLRQRRI